MNKSDTGLSRYLQEIGRIPLLTPQQEIELAAKIKKGDAAARERMINANLRLVVTIAQDYAISVCRCLTLSPRETSD
jgi:RNA polymerase primary sigma factor